MFYKSALKNPLLPEQNLADRLLAEIINANDVSRDRLIVDPELVHVPRHRKATQGVIEVFAAPNHLPIFELFVGVLQARIDVRYGTPIRPDPRDPRPSR